MQRFKVQYEDPDALLSEPSFVAKKGEESRKTDEVEVVVKRIFVADKHEMEVKVLSSTFWASRTFTLVDEIGNIVYDDWVIPPAKC